MAAQSGAPTGAPAGSGTPYRQPTKVIAGITGLMFLAAASAALLSARADQAPERVALDDFPGRIGEWTARIDRLPVMTEEVAGASEYYFADFTADGGGRVNAYVAYYDSQRQGRIPHSPKVCIPGGGWVIESQDTASIRDKSGVQLEVNRLVIALGGRRIIAYYWLKQGPRVYRKETLARLDLVRSSLLENRTDGALIRLTTELGSGEEVRAGEARLRRFAAEFVSRIPAYVPD